IIVIIPRIVVIGNESCDLDSAVCSISLAFHLSKCPSFVETVTDWERIVPVLNLTRAELPLKTEVIYYLQAQQIDLDSLICKDEANFADAAWEHTKFVLVDHHMSPHQANVVGVVDHRPVDPHSNLTDKVFQYIEPVGSCATLVAKLIDQSNMFAKHQEEYMLLFKLLYGAIILDTVNFSEQANKARELDHYMAQLIEQKLGISEPVSNHRKTLFETLVDKRRDVGSLDSLQILSKDLKIIARNGRTVAIPGFPILVQSYVQKPNAESNLLTFAQQTRSDVVVLMGMHVTTGSDQVRRDLGVVNIGDAVLWEKIITALVSSTLPNLSLKRRSGDEFLGGQFFDQGNIAASRKQILPIISNVLDKL
ncbi:exopolyphosphatase PRUNE1-like, partial [Wyeomyia smithii]|uniref:exopolyphosphatase PRUNE1-like n=1 Tax=Wyeomyia smithii TaxID=174621 RepID=UPI002467C3F6